MKIQMNTAKPSTFQQWSDFLNVLNGPKQEGQPLLGRSNSLSSIPVTLEKQLPVEQEPVVFRRLGKHTQLILNFAA